MSDKGRDGESHGNPHHEHSRPPQEIQEGRQHHRHGHAGPGHTHGLVDASISSNERGLWAVKWSFVGLFVTAAFQLVIVLLSNSIALLADTIHNFGDAATAIPLGIAFLFAKRAPTRRFTYGFGRVEDLAGFAVVLTIFGSAAIAFYEAVSRLMRPQPVSHLAGIAAASVIGFLGNELVAIFRIRVGKDIGSAALIADGYHARTDGWTSLAVLVGAIGVYMGYPKADPIIGLVITLAILGIVWQSVKTVFSRMLDGVEPDVIDEVRHAAAHVRGVDAITDVRARWVGHRLRAELSISIAPHLTVEEGHEIAKEVEHQLRHHLKFLSGAAVHVDPAQQAGETYHRVASHSHDGIPAHSH
jgi:cation diffusion facilitator family transporter